MSEIKDNEMFGEDFPSNSKDRRKKVQPPTAEKVVEEKKVEKIVTGAVRTQKRSFGKKLADTFLVDDTMTVSHYIFNDVLIPAAKAMICDMVGWGGIAEMVLFGDKRGGRRLSGGGRGTYVNYDRVSYRPDSSRDQRDTRGRRDISRTARARHNFDELVFETRGDAEDVLSHLVDLTIDYRMASVADLYEFAGVESHFTDDKYGWTELNSSNSGITRERGMRGGYLLNLPRPVPLD